MDETYRNFCQSIIDNIKKNGFPDKKVAFPLEQMYEAAEAKGVNFNKVLETLKSIQIDHKKTPEKIIFFAADREPQIPAPVPITDADTASDPQNPQMSNPFAAFGGLPFGQMPMDMGQMMSMAAEMMKNLSPEQLAAVRDMYENMSDEEKTSILEQAKDIGMFPKDPE